MTELEEQIVKLTKHGLSARKVRIKLGCDLTTDQVGRIARKYVGKTVRTQNSNFNALNDMRIYVEECLRRLGKDPYTCEICEEHQDIRCDIHHTKYDGATIYDLQYACRSCNGSRVNHGLS